MYDGSEHHLFKWFYFSRSTKDIPLPVIASHNILSVRSSTFDHRNLHATARVGIMVWVEEVEKTHRSGSFLSG